MSTRWVVPKIGLCFRRPWLCRKLRFFINDVILLPHLFRTPMVAWPTGLCFYSMRRGLIKWWINTMFNHTTCIRRRQTVGLLYTTADAFHALTLNRCDLMCPWCSCASDSLGAERVDCCSIPEDKTNTWFRSTSDIVTVLCQPLCWTSTACPAVSRCPRYRTSFGDETARRQSRCSFPICRVCIMSERSCKD